MAGKYDALAKIIINNVGGKSNIRSLTHCVTRLRFKLKDENKTNTDLLKDTDGVVTVVQSGGQYQVVIGNHVQDVYEVIMHVTGLSDEVEDDDDESKLSPFAAFVDIISGVFQPVLGVMAATGMIKGLLALAVFMNLLTRDSGAYMILMSAGDGFFHFLPIFLGFTAAKKFKVNPFVGMALGASLMYINDVTVIAANAPISTMFEGSSFAMNVYAKFMGLPITIPMSGYASSVVPIILAVYVASKLESFLKKVIPDVIKAFVVPMLTLSVIVPITFIVVGPVASILTSVIGIATNAAFNFSPVFAGLILGGTWQILVIFGLHWGVIPLAFVNIGSLGYDYILAVIFAASFAQTAVVIAIAMKTKDIKLRALSIPAAISGVFGVTEPAIYGITLPRKKPFFISCIAAAVGGAIIGLGSAKIYMLGGLGIFGIPTFINPVTNDISGMVWALIGAGVAIIIGFIATYITYKDAEKTSNSSKSIGNPTNSNILVSPLNGTVMELFEVEDAAFSSGALGAGVAIMPSEGQLVSPVDGEIMVFFTTKHAIGIKSTNGAEILIHVGMDTVKLAGKHFEAKMKQGDMVKKGDVLLEFDMDAIKKEGYSLITPVVITNSDNYEDIIFESGKEIVKNESLMLLI